MKDIENAENDLLMLLGHRVRDYRKALGISQDRLAELTGVNTTYISNIENAKTNATICIYSRIANGLRVPLSQLVDVTLAKVEKDELSKVFLEIKSLSNREQRMFIATIKGLLAGIKQ